MLTAFKPKQMGLYAVDRRANHASVPFKRRSAYLRTHPAVRRRLLRPVQLRQLKCEQRYRRRLKASNKKAKHVRKRRKRYLKRIRKYTPTVRRRMLKDKTRRFWEMYTVNWRISELKAGSIVRIRTFSKQKTPETVSVLPKDVHKDCLAKAIESRSFGKRTNDRDAVTFRYVRRVSRQNAVRDLRKFIGIAASARTLNAKQRSKLALLKYYLQYNDAERTHNKYDVVIPLHGLRGKRLVRLRAHLDTLTNKQLYGWYFFRDRHLSIIIKIEC